MGESTSHLPGIPVDKTTDKQCWRSVGLAAVLPCQQCNMDAAVIILILGAIVLACGSLALLIVCLVSPKLRGMGWLSGAFASGAAGAGLLLLSSWPLLSVLGADIALLLSFVLLHVAVLRLIHDSSVPFWHGGVLLGLQAIVDVLRLTGPVHTRGRIISISILVALQCFATATVLWHLAQRRVRAPAIFSAVLLITFGIFNLLRSAAEPFVLLHHSLNYRVGIVTFSLYIAVALGLAFGFFWMTTSTLTEEVEHIASTDPLTRLYNRRVFLKWCEKELLRSQRSGIPFSLLMVDLDHFKRINDTYGHQTGDAVLCSAVEKMQDSVRGIDVICRWGGEEFAVLLPNARAEATRIVAERIRENIQKVTLPAARTHREANSFRLTVSIGAATYRDLDDGLAAMFERADNALYDAKNSGRNRVLIAC